MMRTEHRQAACSWCGSPQAVVPDVRDGRRTGNWVCSRRGNIDHILTPCYVPWLLGVPPEEFRAQPGAALAPRPIAFSATDEVTARLADVVKALIRHGWAVAASDVRTLAWSLRDAPDVRAAVAAALAPPEYDIDDVTLDELAARLLTDES